MNAVMLLPRRSAWLLSLSLMWLGWTAVPLQAQRAQEPFSTVEFRVSGTQNINRNFLHTFWKQGAGVEAIVATPFYLGFFELGGAYHRYRAEQAVPDFDALLLYTGWGLGVDVLDRLRLEGSARVGNYRMAFDVDTFNGIKTESELAVMLQARVGVRPWGPISLYASGSYLQAYTFLRLKLWYVSAGVSYRLRSPNWLTDILK